MAFKRISFAMVMDYLKLCRVGNLPTIWTNVLAAAVLSGPEISAADVLIPAVSMSLFYSGGMCMNDVIDRSRDRFLKPLRPIPSGRIPAFHAAVLTGVLFLLGFKALFQAPHPASSLLAVVLLGLIVSYNVSDRKYPKNVLLPAGCRFLVFAVTAAAIRGETGGLVLAAGAVQFVYALVLSVTGRFEKKIHTQFRLPDIPLMVAGFSLIDGLLMSVFASPWWLLAGILCAVLTLLGQKFARSY